MIKIYVLGDDLDFPNPEYSIISDGLVAIGGDLNPERILRAYSKGIFPWYSEGEPILWWSPDPRMILYFDDYKISRSLKKILKKDKFKVKFDTNFEEVIKKCAEVRKEEGTWILPEVQEAYIHLHKLGYAHSVETYNEKGELVGGLYGISIGGMFSGESMFTLENDASKVALTYLVNVLKQNYFDFIDCQIPSEHFARWGAIEIPRKMFLRELKKSLKKKTVVGNWGEIFNVREGI